MKDDTEKRMEDASGTKNSQMSEDDRRALRDKFSMPDVVVRGAIDLFAPMRSRGEDVHALHYDFSTLSGNDLIECLDTDRYADNDNSVTNKQAMALFCRACKKVEHDISGLDEIDIRRQISVRDSVTCVRIGKSFFAHALAGALLSISRT